MKFMTQVAADHAVSRFARMGREMKVVPSGDPDLPFEVVPA